MNREGTLPEGTPPVERTVNEETRRTRPEMSRKAASQMLLYLIFQQSISGVEEALRLGADPNARHGNDPALVIAIWKNNPTIVRLLLDAGARLPVHTRNGHLLGEALSARNPEIMEALFEAGFKLDAAAMSYWNAKCQRLESGLGTFPCRAFDFLVSEDMHFKEPFGDWPPIFLGGAVETADFALLERMRTYPETAEMLRTQGVDLLGRALSARSTEVFFWLLGQGVSTGTMEERITLMQKAVKLALPSCLEALLSRDPRPAREDLRPVLATAIDVSNMAVITRFLRMGVRPDEDDLVRACGRYGLETVRLFLKAVPVSHAQADRILVTALARGNLSTAEELLDLGLAGLEPVDRAFILSIVGSLSIPPRRKKEDLQFLLEYWSADLTAETGIPLVYHAARCGHIQLARCLAKSLNKLPDGFPEDRLAVTRMLKPLWDNRQNLELLETADRALLHHYPEFDLQDLVLVRKAAAAGARWACSPALGNRRYWDSSCTVSPKTLEIITERPCRGSAVALEQLFQRHGLEWEAEDRDKRIVRFEDRRFGGRFASFVTRAIYLSGRYSACRISPGEFRD